MALSFQEEVSNGVKTVYSLDFEYISRSDVNIYKGSHQLPVAMAFKWVDDSTVELTNINVDAPDGTKFWIRRIMPRKALLHIFENKSIRPVTLDQQNYQALYLIQEFADGFSSLDGILELQNNINMNGHAVTGSRDPLLPQDLSTKNYSDTQDEQLKQHSDAGDAALRTDIDDLILGRVKKTGDTMSGQLKVPVQSTGSPAEVLSSSEVQRALDNMQRSLLDLIKYPLNLDDRGFVDVNADEFEDRGLITAPVDEFEDYGRLTSTGLV